MSGPPPADIPGGYRSPADRALADVAHRFTWLEVSDSDRRITAEYRARDEARALRDTRARQGTSTRTWRESSRHAVHSMALRPPHHPGWSSVTTLDGRSVPPWMVDQYHPGW